MPQLPLPPTSLITSENIKMTKKLKNDNNNKNKETADMNLVEET